MQSLACGSVADDGAFLPTPPAITGIQTPSQPFPAHRLTHKNLPIFSTYLTTSVSLPPLTPPLFPIPVETPLPPQQVV